MNPLLAELLRILLFFAGSAVSALPRRLELRLGPALGRLYFFLDPKRRRIARDNMARCLPNLPAERREELLRENYAHYGTLGLELLHMFSPRPGHYRRYALKISRLEGFEHWRRAHDRGRGVLFVSAHMANWEMMAAAGAMRGIPLTIATRRLKPEWLHKKIESARYSTGFRCAYLPGTLPSILKALRKGESFGFVLDQYAPPPMGIPVTFFGAKVDTLAAVGTFAQRYRAAIVPVTQYRDADGIVHVRIEPEMDLSSVLDDQTQVTQALVLKVEQWIRANPSQWLWVHRRFKNAAWPKEAALPR